MHVTYNDIIQAQQRIESVAVRTPILNSQLLDQWMSQRLSDGQTHQVFFKAECFQKTGAFKIRGATNFIAKCAAENRLPKRFVANSSGNHAQAVACASRHYDIPATIFSTKNISPIKAAATRHYGAQLELFDTRVEADHAVEKASKQSGVSWIPPFNHNDIIAGQGTVIAESLNQIDDINAIFVPCGGGGLASGSLVASRQLSSSTKVFAAEPLQANDAAQSLKQGKIVPLPSPPITLADGAATPSVGELTFPFLQQLDGLYEVNEDDICYWSQWLHHLLKIHVEPTCCMTMQAVSDWLSNQTSPQRVLVVLSGGNISQTSMKTLWLKDFLTLTPEQKMAGIIK